MSGKAVRPTLSIGGYGIPAIPTQSVGGYSILAIPTQSAAYMWLRGGGCVRMAWGGCVGMAGMPYPPINTSAPTDADVCADRCGCLRRPMRMSASTDANHAGRTFLLWQAAKQSAARLFTTLLVLPYSNDQQCIIKKKTVRHHVTPLFIFINTD